MKLTIKDIAKLSNVSPSTVSRILNGQTKHVKPDKVAKVNAVIEETNYKPSPIARGLVTKKTNTIALIVPDITNPFFTELARGIEQVANEQDYFVFLCNSEHKAKKEKNYLSKLKDKYIDGIILVSCIHDLDYHLEANKKTKLPIVYVDLDLKGYELNSVCFDNVHGGYQATKHLIDLGHREIGCISGPRQVQTAIHRLEGYKKALKEAGIPIRKEYIHTGNYKYGSGLIGAQKLLENKEMTAIFACNDMMAYGAHECLMNRNIRVPNEFSLVGFDGITPIGYSNTFLTTVPQPYYKMGISAGEILLEELMSGETYSENILFDASLLIKESTGKNK